MELASILPALQAAWPVIISLVILEGLLSVDNAMVLAAMVQHLPGKQKSLALKLGIIGAYVMRGISLVFVSFIVALPGLHLIGGLYLIHLMTSNLGLAEEGEGDSHSATGKGFWATVIAVEIADMMFSIDNIVAAVAMTDKLWVVIVGVFIGIAAMRFVAGIFVKLIEKFPILNQIAFLLVGFVGVQLCVEQFFPHAEMTELQKFGGIMAIIAGGLIYDKSAFLQKVFGPTVRWIGEGFGNINEMVEWAWKPFGFVIGGVIGGFKRVFGIGKNADASETH
jgi:tellurite resistance protein TerC